MKELLVPAIRVFCVHAYGQLPPAASQQVDYERDIRPILSQTCYSCHGPAVQQSGLRLDLQNALCGGDYGPSSSPVTVRTAN